MQVLLDQTIGSLNENARVLYSMQWNNEHKMVSKQRLAGALGDMSGSGAGGSVRSGYARSDEDALQA